MALLVRLFRETSIKIELSILSTYSVRRLTKYFNYLSGYYKILFPLDIIIIIIIIIIIANILTG